MGWNVKLVGTPGGAGVAVAGRIMGSLTTVKFETESVHPRFYGSFLIRVSGAGGRMFKA
jgi:hypothetical protein